LLPLECLVRSFVLLPFEPFLRALAFFNRFSLFKEPQPSPILSIKPLLLGPSPPVFFSYMARLTFRALPAPAPPTRLPFGISLIRRSPSSFFFLDPPVNRPPADSTFLELAGFSPTGRYVPKASLERPGFPPSPLSPDLSYLLTSLLWPPDDPPFHLSREAKTHLIPPFRLVHSCPVFDCSLPSFF